MNVPQIWCKECGSDTEGAHYGSCPLHPTKQAVAARYSGRPALTDAIAKANSPSPQNMSKADWFEADSQLSFSADQMKKVIEYFMLNILDLVGIEVVQIKSTNKKTVVTFKKRPVIKIDYQEVFNDVDMDGQREATGTTDEAVSTQV